MRFRFFIFCAFLCVFVYQAFSQGIVISEIFRDPAGSETALCGGLSHEFVEIANSGSDTFFIDSLFITDGTEADSVIPWDTPLPGHQYCITGRRFLSAGQTALILDPDYLRAIQQNPTCGLDIDSGTVLFRCGDSEFGRDGLAADDGVILYKGTKLHIESVVCQAADQMSLPDSPVWGKIVLSKPNDIEGVSIVLQSFLLDTVIYDYCSSLISPGFFEMINAGWLVDSKFFNWNYNISTVSCSLVCLKSNSITESENTWFLKAVSDGNTRKIIDGALVPGARKSTLVFDLPLQAVDYYFVLKMAEWFIDISEIWSPSSSVKINEIFPRAVSGEPEWIELTNGASMTLNLKNWQFGNSEDTVFLSTGDYQLEPGGYVLVTKDKKALLGRYPGLKTVIEPPVWHTLDNFRDTVYLFDSRGYVRDTVCYENNWFENWKYQSLERTGTDNNGANKSSWVLSSHSTPGYPNSVLTWRSVEVPALEIGPIPFTPDNDGKDDLLMIQLSIPASQLLTLSIYSFNGLKVREFMGPIKQRYFWDGKGSNGKPVQPGPFFVIARIENSGQSSYIRKKGVLWR